MSAHVVPWRDEYRADFERLNRLWIEAHFRLEQPDRDIFADPYGHVVARGGQVFFVVDDETVWGTCAVLRHGDEWELAKMAVAPEARGRGYGDMLMAAAIAFARAAGAPVLSLRTNAVLAPAIRLYEKHGFRHVPLAEREEYSRANVAMQLRLDSGG